MQLNAADIVSLLSTYGYPALGVVVALAAAGVPIPAPVTMIFITLGVLSATAHGPNLLALLVIGTLAATLGHSADYGLGYSGNRLMQRLRAWLERRMGAHKLGRIERQLARSNALVILLTRFPLTPLASPVSLLAGASRIAYRRFLLLELLGDAAYFTTCLLLGRLLGPTLLRHLTPFALGSLVVMLLLLALIALMRSRTRSRPTSKAHPSLEETVESAEGQSLLSRSSIKP
jgi:membrane protein DedA with SNARE-associated domain